MSDDVKSVKSKREFSFHVSKRDNLSLPKKIGLYVGAIATALAIGAVFLACMGYNPFLFYGKLLIGNFENPIYLKSLIWTTVPLLITSLGISLAFKMRFWNIGAEGQFIMGAIMAMTAALLIGDKLPSFVGLLIVLVAGALGGGIYGALTAVFKVAFNTNETLLTLMFNYIALYLLTYFLNTDTFDFFIQTGNGIPTFKIISQNLWLSEIKIGTFSFDTSVFIALALLVVVFVFFRYTKGGYRVNVVGDSPNTARYAGMKVGRLVILTMFFSSAIIGLAGALQLTGSSASHTLGTNITGGVGWTGIIVAWLAKLNPLSIGVVSLLMGMLDNGASIARSVYGISASMADILQGIILFSVLAFDFFIGYKITRRKKAPAVVNDAADDTPCEDNTPADGSATVESNLTVQSDAAICPPEGADVADAADCGAAPIANGTPLATEKTKPAARKKAATVSGAVSNKTAKSDGIKFVSAEDGKKPAAKTKAAKADAPKTTSKASAPRKAAKKEEK